MAKKKSTKAQVEENVRRDQVKAKIIDLTRKLASFHPDAVTKIQALLDEL